MNIEKIEGDINNGLNFNSYGEQIIAQLLLEILKQTKDTKALFKERQ